MMNGSQRIQMMYEVTKRNSDMLEERDEQECRRGSKFMPVLGDGMTF